MKKEEIRKEFFKLKNKGFSYVQCRRIIQATFEYEVSQRTLKRWIKRLDSGKWDLQDNSRKPHTIHQKVNEEIKQEVIALREKTGWGADKLYLHLGNLGISQITIHRILQKQGLCRLCFAWILTL